ncbi:sugar carrier protein C-like [Arachis stenosperma]|uniref:sugar carrier protein C-like n=1 Tax=Arachis stenosperma TaxID=217475 RepID=UPI0025AC4FE6|nr:sugar carrier protein C-like [Arachis stenosperma]
MADGLIGEGSANGKQYPGKLTFRALMSCIIAAFGGLLKTWLGGVTSMSPFLKKFFPNVYAKKLNVKPSENLYCTFDSQVLTIFISSLYLAAFVASLCASSITRIFGRRLTMLSGGILFLAGAGFNAFAQKVWMLIVGRMLLGFGIGCANQSVPIYVSEVAPHKYRGALNMMFQLAITIGIFVANVLNCFFVTMNNGEGWRYSLGFAAVPAVMIVIGAIFLPDSPSSLIERGKNEKAKQELIKMRGTTDVDEEFNDLVEASESPRSVKNPWATLLKRHYRPQLVIAIAIPLFQQLTGVNVITFYAPVLFRAVGFSSEPSCLLASMVIAIFNALATFILIFTVNKIGRRKLFFGGGAQMFICQIVLTTAIASEFGIDGNPESLTTLYVVFVVSFICFYVMGFAWSWAPLGWLIPLFPLEVRPAAQSIIVSVSMIFNFVIAQVFTSMFCHIKFGLFIIFAFFVLVMSGFIYIFLPEIKGAPIEVVWQNHFYWKKFVKSASAASEEVNTNVDNSC